MSTIDEIKKPIAEEMKAFEPKFRSSMASRVALLDRITHYIVKRKGKQIRPMLVFLSAKLHGEVNEATYLGASLIELMHTATLVHDDVVDDSNQRRGFWSINAIWKNKIAILVGDYLLSKVLLLAVEKEEYDLLKIVSTSVREMSEGELLQIEKARKLDITEDIYFDIIRQKTASLIASCCGVGSSSVGASKSEVEDMRQFGEWLGLAFQIKDDLFDFQLKNNTGKPSGIDIKEQKMTLPLIYVLNQCSKKEKSWLINSIKNHNKDSKRVKEVIAFVKTNGGLDYAVSQMKAFQEQALQLLEPFPESPYKKSLILMVNYVIERNK